MSGDTPINTPVGGEAGALTPAQAARRQRAYAAQRRAWARAVGRPYTRKARDPRPPPGEIDVPADVPAEE